MRNGSAGYLLMSIVVCVLLLFRNNVFVTKISSYGYPLD
ncbi:hypothetical protein PORCRE_877 [Porphyromonas crevioricanis JCM 15906]|uniref:Uncharacterized protein n=1 Tax=Porphyromonas crevioricanis JCM 15906 TaxID=1305617 RepID=T1CN14_9PORP|nr:hypothetical protein PORCRE_877 [Porphyromonas crevioricanis JCM 15906]GAD07151.1 hypothetical protein PORCAN_768 [Porphyromonas crevioricanis JCM 13913]